MLSYYFLTPNSVGQSHEIVPPSPQSCPYYIYLLIQNIFNKYWLSIYTTWGTL